MSPSLLSVQHLSKSFPILGGVWRRTVGEVQALKGVSFSIQAGETVAMVGGSGCGKSTVAKILVGLLAPEAGGVYWQGQSLLAMRREARARCMQMIFQDPFASLNPRLSVETQLNEMVQQKDATLTGASLRDRAVALLEQVGMPADTLRHYPFQFSGGQRQRIAIARALTLEPVLLVADEPLSALDVSVQAQILELFGMLKKKLGLTMLLITHDLAVAAQQADRLLVLENGQLVEEGSTAQVIQQPKHSYTKSLLDAVPRLPC
jgi:ABC-type oligopeptide transport system ATPase subunit